MFSVETIDGEKVSAKYLQFKVYPRYWEDAQFDGIEDIAGTLVPFRDDESWGGTIDLASGVMLNWPNITMTSCYKVTDSGTYNLLDENQKVVATAKGKFVPAILACDGDWMEYLELTIDNDGKIQNWNVSNLSQSKWIAPI